MVNSSKDWEGKNQMLLGVFAIIFDKVCQHLELLAKRICEITGCEKPQFLKDVGMVQTYQLNQFFDSEELMRKLNRFVTHHKNLSQTLFHTELNNIQNDILYQYMQVFEHMRTDIRIFIIDTNEAMQRAESTVPKKLIGFVDRAWECAFNRTYDTIAIIRDDVQGMQASSFSNENELFAQYEAHILGSA
jgi:hypothetical protein